MEIPRNWRLNDSARVVSLAARNGTSLARAAIELHKLKQGRSVAQIIKDHEIYVQGIKAELIEEALGEVPVQILIPIFANDLG